MKRGLLSIMDGVSMLQSFPLPLATLCMRSVREVDVPSSETSASLSRCVSASWASVTHMALWGPSMRNAAWSWFGERLVSATCGLLTGDRPSRRCLSS